MSPKSHPYWEENCRLDRYYKGNGFIDGHYSNISEVCCTSTNLGLQHLKEKGIWETLPDNSTKIVTSTNKSTFFIPPALKQVPIAEWTVEDTKWLNM